MSLNLTRLAAAIQDWTPDEPATTAAIRQALAEALGDCTEDDPTPAEALLSCVLQSFTSAAEKGKALLDDMLLELLPALASLAPYSEACSQSLAAFCSLAVAACSPRDTVTAFLEVLDQLLGESHGWATMQLMCNILTLLPQQLASLSRRKAAFSVECFAPAANLAKVHGQMLAAWTLAQLTLAAQQTGAVQPGGSVNQAAAEVLSRLDTFLAANWQMYVDFVRDILHKVLPQEQDSAARDKASKTLGQLVLQLLQYLTAVWPPPGVSPLALQLLSVPNTPQHMPSPDSVAPPLPMLAALQPRQASVTMRVSGQTASTQQPPEQQQPQRHESDAVAAVLELVQLLQECGCTSWQSLAEQQGVAGAGAGLAALYSGCLAAEQHGSTQLVLPDSVLATVQAACCWCCTLVEVSDNNSLAIVKAIALLQLAASHSQQLQHGPSIAGTTGQPPRGSMAAFYSAAASQPPQAAAEAQAASLQLLPQLQPCVELLASVIAQAPVQALRTQASVGLQKLLQALPKTWCYACLQLLLSAGKCRVHAEAAALLIQEVRLQLANSTSGLSCFNPCSSVDLVLPWLQQQGPVGWLNIDTLADHANALCAGLAVVRLALLRTKAATGNASAEADAADAHVALQQALQGPLNSLSGAVKAALQQLQAANSEEQKAGPQAAHAASSSNTASDGRQYIPGVAQGEGLAVDVWLAVSRVQDVLDRVLELLEAH